MQAYKSFPSTERGASQNDAKALQVNAKCMIETVAGLVRTMESATIDSSHSLAIPAAVWRPF